MRAKLPCAYPEQIQQQELAAKLCITLGTLRHWERGDRKPHDPALALLHVVAEEPQAGVPIKINEQPPGQVEGTGSTSGDHRE